jgi:hypothetical protein
MVTLMGAVNRYEAPALARVGLGLTTVPTFVSLTGANNRNVTSALARVGLGVTTVRTITTLVGAVITGMEPLSHPCRVGLGVTIVLNPLRGWHRYMLLVEPRLCPSPAMVITF